MLEQTEEPERRARMVKLARRDLRDPLEKPDPLGLQEREAHQELLEVRAGKERKVPRVRPVQKALPVKPDQWDPRGPLESPVLKVYVESQDQLENKVYQEHQVKMAPLVPWVLPDSQA